MARDKMEKTVGLGIILMSVCTVIGGIMEALFHHPGERSTKTDFSNEL